MVVEKNVRIPERFFDNRYTEIKRQSLCFGSAFFGGAAMKKNIFRILGFASDNNLIPLFLFLVFSLFPAHAFGAAASFVWSANTESDLAGYKIYYGTFSGNYTQYVDVGNTTEYTQTGLQDGVTYYFASTAYDTAGNESDFSTEIEVDASGQQNQNPDPPTTPTGPSSGYTQNHNPASPRIDPISAHEWHIQQVH